MANSRDEERERREGASREEDEKRREGDKERRSSELKESWRRNHPSGEEDEGKGRPGRGRQP